MVHDTRLGEPGMLGNAQVTQIKGNSGEGFLVALAVP
jgi:hypothetical protein